MRARSAELVVRARELLELDLFRDPPPQARDPRVRLALIGFFCLAVIVQLLRMWSSRPLDSLFIEDASVWLPGALSRDTLEALSTPFNGYLQTVSRLVAEPVAALPVEAYAPAMAIAGAAIVAASACVVWRASAGYFESRYLRGALVALMILLPVVGAESLATVTNSIWFLLYACMWALLWRPKSRGETAVAAGVVALAALSNLGVLFLLPIWLARALVIRDRSDLAIVAAFAAALVIQLAFSADEIGLRGEEGDPVRANDLPACEPFSTAACWDWELVPAYGQRVVGGAIAGQQVNGELWKLAGNLWIVVLAAGLLALLWAAVRDLHTRWLVPLLVLTSAALFLVSGYQRWGAGGLFFLWPEGEFREGSHYLITPTLLLLTAILLQLDRARSAVAVAATAFIVLVSADRLRGRRTRPPEAPSPGPSGWMRQRPNALLRRRPSRSTFSPACVYNVPDHRALREASLIRARRQVGGLSAVSAAWKPETARSRGA